MSSTIKWFLPAAGSVSILQLYRLLEVCLCAVLSLGPSWFNFTIKGDGRGEWVTPHNFGKYQLLTVNCSSGTAWIHLSLGAGEPQYRIQTGKCQNFVIFVFCFPPSPLLIPSWHYLMWWVTLESSIFCRKASLLST